MMQTACKNLDKVAHNQKFVVKDLFEGCEWQKLTKGDKIQFGKYFKNEVMDNRVPNVCYLERAKNNHALYIKINSQEK